jgi:signal peptidase II
MSKQLINKYIWITLIVIIFDQLTKFFVQHFMALYDSIKLTTNFFWLTYVHNTGAAFSLKFGGDSFNRIIFSIITIVLTTVVFYLLIKTKSKLEAIAYSLIIGGAIGNLIDRIRFGYVIDFIDWDFPDFIMERWPVFNIADSAIVVAVILLFVNLLFIEKRIESEDK